MVIPLYVFCCFSLAAFNIFSLYLIFDSLINMCLGADVSLSFMEFSDSAINPTSFIHRMYKLIRREDLKPIIMEILHYSYLEY